VKHATAAQRAPWLVSSRPWLRSHVVPRAGHRAPMPVKRARAVQTKVSYSKGRLLLPRSAAAGFGRISLVLRPSPGASKCTPPSGLALLGVCPAACVPSGVLQRDRVGRIVGGGWTGPRGRWETGPFAVCTYVASVVGTSMGPPVVGRGWSPVPSNKARGCCYRTPGGHRAPQQPGRAARRYLRVRWCSLQAARAGSRRSVAGPKTRPQVLAMTAPALVLCTGVGVGGGSRCRRRGLGEGSYRQTRSRRHRAI
jgi:hypothetical protein